MTDSDRLDYLEEHLNSLYRLTGADRNATWGGRISKTFKDGPQEGESLSLMIQHKTIREFIDEAANK